MRRSPEKKLRGLVNRLVLIAVCGLAALAVAGPGLAAVPPNVLVIVTDDQRAGTTTVMPKTAHWFGDQGRFFPRGFVTTPLCCPARASIFTGLYTHNHGVVNNGTSKLDHSLTLQRYLSEAGYKTAIVGKFLNSWWIRRAPPHFQHFAISAGSAGYYDSTFNIDGTVRQVSAYATTFTGRKTISYLRGFEQNDDQPWFMYVATRAPHPPATPEPKYASAAVPPWSLNPAVLEQDRSDKPTWVRSQNNSRNAIRDLRAAQLRTLMSVDDLVGNVLKELGSLGERRRTLAVFTSDNGFMWGEHGVASKRYPYTDSIKVPFLMRWPGVVNPGSRDSRFVTNVDVAPTILAAAGITPATPMDGRSLLDDWQRPHLFTEYWRDVDYTNIPGWESIRTRRVHYIRYYTDDRSKVVFREYYRLKNDPWELRNVFGDSTATNNPDTSRLNRLLRRYRNCSGTTCP